MALRRLRRAVGAVALLVALAGAVVVIVPGGSRDPVPARSAGDEPCLDVSVRSRPADALVKLAAGGDFDGDGRADRFMLYKTFAYADVPAAPDSAEAAFSEPLRRRRGRWRLRMELGSGAVVDNAVDEVPSRTDPYGDVLAVVDVQGDGADEILAFAGGNTAVHLAVLAYDGCRIGPALLAGRRAELFYHGSGIGYLSGGPGGGIGCQDVDGDGRRELTAFLSEGDRATRGDRDWLRTAYRLDGLRLTRISARRVPDPRDFAIAMDGIECTAPGRVADGVYLAQLDELDRVSGRTRFEVLCVSGSVMPAAPPIVVGLGAAAIWLPTARGAAGAGDQVGGSFADWAALYRGGEDEMASWLHFKRRLPQPAVAAPDAWQVTVRDGGATAVRPADLDGPQGC